eukprot:CAMPEP_0196133584 /NCGR_PEP_ID=MMETSP0910-20130528/2751_1 /TAXON_ID=49265 /ORGANISM="Thalassiosira rotula, Strain GSO102" /LENGTH=329 /DNA_ID=CAMNT_0041393327 /DNA_START=80 /DNA_END=1069 /DNA_ORIENTATION=-
MATTVGQQMAVAIAPKFTAAASAISSTTTIFLITCRSSEKRTYHRLVLGMSMCDLSASAAWFFTTWPIPRGTPGVYGAMGNQQTCSAQAFFAQFSLSTVMYNASLAIYYVLVIVKGWADHDIVKIEPFLHANAIAWGLGTGLASLALTLFNPVGWDCWLSAAPLGCQESWNSPDGTTTCERGDNGSIYQWAFYYAPLWFVIFFVACLLYWVYHNVSAHETHMQASYQGLLSQIPSTATSNHKKIARQAAAYVGSFFFTWLFPTIFQLVIVTMGNPPWILLFLTALFVPIQGVFILVIFIRPAYLKYRRAHPEEFFIAAWFRMMRQEIAK